MFDLFTKGRAVGLMEAGMSIRNVAQRIGVNKDTVRRWMARFRQTGTARGMPGGGRPKKTNVREERALIRVVERNRKMSAVTLIVNFYHRFRLSKQTIIRRLNKQGYTSCRVAKVPRLNAVHRQNRMTWAINHSFWNDNRWRRVVWSDEVRIMLHTVDGRARVWRRPGERFRDDLVQETVAAGGGSIMLWAAFWGTGKSAVRIIEGNVNGEEYRNILAEFLNTNREALDDQGIWWLQDDNARPHRARIVREFKEAHGIRQLPWPAVSPDLNPIEHVWHRLKRGLRLRHIESLPQLRQAVVQEWAAIDNEFFETLILSMRNRIREVLNSNGGHTRY